MSTVKVAIVREGSFNDQDCISVQETLEFHEARRIQSNSDDCEPVLSLLYYKFLCLPMANTPIHKIKKTHEL